MTTNLIDLTGRRFGWLRVLARAANDARNRTQWLCVCGCGKESIKPGASLRDGNTTSCGCKPALQGRGKRFTRLYDAKRRAAR